MKRIGLLLFCIQVMSCTKVLNSQMKNLTGVWTGSDLKTYVSEKYGYQFQYAYFLNLEVISDEKIVANDANLRDRISSITVMVPPKLQKEGIKSIDQLKEYLSKSSRYHNIQWEQLTVNGFQSLFHASDQGDYQEQMYFVINPLPTGITYIVQLELQVLVVEGEEASYISAIPATVEATNEFLDPGIPQFGPQFSFSLSPSLSTNNNHTVVEGSDELGTFDEFYYEHKLFVTSTSYRGDLGGSLGADEKCQTAAETVALPGIYRALLSDGASITARYRVPIKGKITNTRDIILAHHLNDLFDGYLIEAVGYDEYGNEVEGETAWTGSSSMGYSSASEHCENWTSSSNEYNGTYGLAGDHTGWMCEGSHPCSYYKRLYCISQPQSL